METGKKDDIVNSIILICDKMLKGEIDLLVGCYEITKLFHRGLSVGIFHESDDDFSIFRGIESETDEHERNKLMRSGMSEKQVDKEFQDTVEYYRNDIINGCKTILTKLTEHKKNKQGSEPNEKK